MPDRADALLAVRDLSVTFGTPDGPVDAVRSATFEVRRGEVLGLVGESGSGKTVTSLAIMGLAGEIGGRVVGGSVTFDGVDLLALDKRLLRRIRGRRIAMIFQQPTRSLNPAWTVGEQIAEVVRVHHGLRRRPAWARAVQLLDRVHIADAARRAHDYPHTYSGGMCQRAMIAIALASEPELLIADEPTTALDVTVQARILELIEEIRVDTGVSVLYITHDLGVVAELCHRVAVMYAGETVESGPIGELFERPRHPYTEGLLRSLVGPATGERFFAIPGRVPLPTEMPDGCRFHPRCPYAVPGPCTDRRIDLVAGPDASAAGHATRCARTHELTLQGALT